MAATADGGRLTIRVVGAEPKPTDWWLRVLHKRLHPACVALQAALAVVIVVVTATELASQTGSNGVEGQCLISSSTAPDLCTYMYLLCAIPLLFTLLAATCPSCCMCSPQPLGPVCFGAYALAGWIWWCVAAGVVTAAVSCALPPEFSGGQAARVALAVLLWLQVLAYAVMVAASATRGQCRCCAADDIENSKFQCQPGDTAPPRRDQPSPFWATGRLTRQQQVLGGILALQLAGPAGGG